MQRLPLFFGFLAAVLAAGNAMAQNLEDHIVDQLRAQGFNAVTVNDTWLGRTRIVGQSGQGTREIIIDPGTGEILRDLFEGAEATQHIIDTQPDSNPDAGGVIDGVADSGLVGSGDGASGSESSDTGEGVGQGVTVDIGVSNSVVDGLTADGAPLDAGVPVDDGVPVDAGVPVDDGVPVDASEPVGEGVIDGMGGHEGTSVGDSVGE